MGFIIILIFFINKKEIIRLNLEIILTLSSFIIILICFLPSIKVLFSLEIESKIINNIIFIIIFSYQ